MALEEGFSEHETSSSTSSNNQLPLAIPQRDFECPICLDTIEEETSVSWCRHAFCFPCILEWACIRPVCPICQEPFQYLFRKVGENRYEVYYTRSPRRHRGRRHHHHSAERRHYHSTDHWHHRSSRRERSRSYSRDWERGRSRSRRRNRDGHSRARQVQSYDPSGSRRWHRSRGQDTASETSHGWDRAARHEQDVPVHLGRSEHRQQTEWDSSRESRARSRQRPRRSHSARRQTQREEQRRGDHSARSPARPEQDVPDSSGRSEDHQPAQWDSSREPQATRRQSRQSRQASHSPEGQRERAGQEPRVSLVCSQMALQKGLAEGGTSSPTASNNQVLQSESPPNSENQMCPICLDVINNQVSVSWCSHAFCFPCILEWSRNRAVCPICREPFRYLLRKVGDNSYEVYSIGHYISFPRHHRGRRHHHHSAERRHYHSTGHWHHRSSRRERSRSYSRDWERDRSRSRRRNRDGHSRARQVQSYDPSGSRRWHRSRGQDTASETSHGWDRAARHEQDVPVHLGRSEHRQQTEWDSSRESRARSRQRPRRSHSARRQTQREEQRRGDHSARSPARPEQDVPDSSGRNEDHQPAQWDSSREPQATRRQSRQSQQASHSPEGQRERAGQEPRVSLVCSQMALQKGLAEGGTSSPTASNNQVLQSESPPNSENQMCPICLDVINNQVSVSWCSHAFCFPCILEWSRNRAVCPICREPFRYLLRKVGDNSYEVYYTRSPRRHRRRRHHHHSAERRHYHSTDHWQHRSSRRERSRSYSRDWERDRSRSRRRNRDGHSRARQVQSYDPSGSRRWHRSRGQDTASETSHGWDRAARHEQDVPVHLGRSEHRQQTEWDSSRESPVTRSRSP